MKKFEISFLIGIIFSVLFTSLTGFYARCESVSEDVLRLHILANSDSKEDQDLKLLVRDAVLDKSEDLFTDTGTKQLAEENAKANLAEIEKTTGEVIKGLGYSYSVKAEVVNMYFNTREYEDFTLAAGYYDAVRVTIGEGKGKNWWCVMFPPMCLPAVSEHDTGGIEEEILNLSHEPAYKAKFAVVELFEKIKSSADM